MIKELKYAFYSIVLFLFIFFCGRYYFSDNYEKKYYRSMEDIEIKIKKHEDNLVILENNTKNIIEYPENQKSKKKKKYFFWNLILNDEKY